MKIEYISTLLFYKTEPFKQVLFSFAFQSFKWVIFALVECLEQSYLRKFRVTQFFSSTLFPHIVSTLEYFLHPSEETIKVFIK